VSDAVFNTPGANPNVPQIADPVADVGALVNSVSSLKQGVDSLAGHRGGAKQRAVTFNDLVALGFIPATNTASGGPGNNPTGFATNAALNSEAKTRADDDDAEEAARIVADADEATTRAAADGVLANDINAEEAVRIAADTALQNDIDNESIARANADAAEATDRAAADTNLQNQINALQTPVVTYAGLPASPTVGQDAVVTDATVNTWGAAVTVGGGGMVVKVWWTGAAWSVLGRA
jgi:hypothetical protein